MKHKSNIPYFPNFSKKNDLELITLLREQIFQLETFEKEIPKIEKIHSELLESSKRLNMVFTQYRGVFNEWDWFFEHSLDMLCVASTNGYFKRVNNAFAKSLGYTKKELLAKPYFNFIHPKDRTKTKKEVKRLNSGKNTINFENRYRHKDGSWHWLSWTCPATNSGNHYMYAIARDITDQKLNQQEMLFKAQHDALTNLLNRAMFDFSLEESKFRMERNPHISVALTLIDLDGFKKINDTKGHLIGDQVLKEVSIRLQKSVRKNDKLFRIGGDEFAIISEGKSPLRLEQMIKRILKIMSKPIPFIPNMKFGCSIGVSSCPYPAQKISSLFTQADKAMYISKKEGKNRCHYYEPK